MTHTMLKVRICQPNMIGNDSCGQDGLPLLTFQSCMLLFVAAKLKLDDPRQPT